MSRRRSQLHQREIHDSRSEEAYKPRVVVEEVQRSDGEPDQRDGYAKNQRHDGTRIDALGIVIGTFAVIERIHVEHGIADKKVVSDHDSSHGSKQARVSDQPAEYITIWCCKQFPRAHGQTEKTGQQSAGAKADEPRIKI